MGFEGICVKFVRYALLGLVLFAPAALAAHWQPTAAESDAFIRAYGYPVMRALMEEGLDLKVQSGKVSPALAACLKRNMQLDALLAPLRPFVAHTFTSRRSLRRAAAFFRSSAGMKVKAYRVQVWRERLRETSAVQPPPAGDTPQFDATPAESAAASRFFRSQAGKDFENFERAGTPALGAVDVFGTAVERCAKQAGH